VNRSFLKWDARRFLGRETFKCTSPSRTVILAISNLISNSCNFSLYHTGVGLYIIQVLSWGWYMNSQTISAPYPLKVLPGQIGYAWEWYHWIGLLEEDIQFFYFFKFFFYLIYLIRVQSSEPLRATMNPTSCLFGSWFACAQTVIFSTEPVLQKCVRDSIFLWITTCE
jgi:hypothetical protein